jgi:Lrp/AsnC family transcriptional regulator for asnA, asnC and gidA
MDSETLYEPLDEIDLRIIDELRKDGRIAFAQIAEKLKVSPGMIRLRYNHLVEIGAVKVVGITNPLYLGFQQMALIGLRVQGRKLMEVAENIAALDEVIYLIVTSGSYDIICEVLCRDRESLLRFLTDRLYVIDGVRESETFVHLKIVKEVYM